MDLRPDASAGLGVTGAISALSFLPHLGFA
jgi:hypothetical protein